MKNEYALDFAPDRVTLLSGTGKKQTSLGEVAFDDPHFGTRLEDLRKEVEADGDAPLSPTLLIPHSEVLFHSMKVEEGSDDETRAKAVAAELEGMTPYAVEDLVFDWKATGKTQVQIAAVARETLDEADDFAAQHGFGPGGFSTPPNSSAFRGQPDFGRSARPMPEPIAVSEPEPMPEPEAVAPSVPASGAVEGVVDEKTDSTLSETVEDAPPSEKTDVTPDSAVTDTPGGADLIPSDQTTDVPVTTTKDEVAKLATRATETNGTAPNDAPQDKAPSEPAPAQTTEQFKSTQPPPPPGAAKGFASRRVAESGGKTPSGQDASRLTEIASRIAMLPDGGAGPKAPLRPDTGKTSPSKSAPVLAAATGAAATAGTAAPLRGAPGPAAPTPTVRRVDPPQDGAAPTPGSARPRPALSEAEALTVFGMRESRRSPLATFLPVLIGLAVAIVLAVLIWSIFFFLNPSEQDTSALDDTVIAAEPAPDAAVSPPTPSDMADVTPDAIRPPGPESDSVDQIPDTEGDTVIAALPEAELPTEEALSPEPEETQPLVIVEETVPEAPEADTQETAEVTPEDEPEPEIAAQPDLPEPLPDDPLRRSADAPEETRYAATGVSTAIPNAPAAPQTTPADVDAAPVSDSTVELREAVPAPAAPDLVAFTPPAALLPPPAADARFEFGPDGRIVATPEGALTPQGVRITAGPPAIEPPPAPNRLEPAATPQVEVGEDPQPEDAPADQDAEAVTTTEPTPLPDDEQGLEIPVTEGAPSATPPARPADDQAALAEDDPVEATRVALGGTALSALADITPRPRATTLGTSEPLEPTQVSLLSPRARPTDLTGEPEAIEEPDAEAAAETAAAIEAILPEAVEEPNPIVATSPYAVASSLLPVGRPRGFTDRIAQQRAQRQQQQQRQQAEPVQVATAAAVVTPRNPTQGSVASRATEPNKIRLNDVNLIGVYGTSSNRRALVRLPNGRFVKVRVGDTVDGGRVSAIGADALRYEKRGRSMTLTMPSG